MAKADWAPDMCSMAHGPGISRCVVEAGAGTSYEASRKALTLFWGFVSPQSRFHLAYQNRHILSPGFEGGCARGADLRGGMP